MGDGSRSEQGDLLDRPPGFGSAGVFFLRDYETAGRSRRQKGMTRWLTIGWVVMRASAARAEPPSCAALAEAAEVAPGELIEEEREPRDDEPEQQQSDQAHPTVMHGGTQGRFGSGVVRVRGGNIPLQALAG